MAPSSIALSSQKIFFMRLTTTLCIIAGSLFSLCGCSKENTTPTPLAARETNIFGWPVGSENCKPSKLVHHSSFGDYTVFYNYNSYGLVESIIEPGSADTAAFFYDANNRVAKITNGADEEWRFIYNSTAGQRASAFYHIDNGNAVKDTFNVTYPAARTFVISVRHPFADSIFRDTILLNNNYNPVTFKRTRQGSSNDSTSTFIMQVDYAYSSALNPLTAEAALWNWIMPLYTDMRLLLSDPLALDRRFTFYFAEIIPFGNNLQQSYTYTGLGVGSFTGAISTAITNSNNYPTSFIYNAGGESATYTFDYNCQ
jgi:hypothetical protein